MKAFAIGGLVLGSIFLVSLALVVLSIFAFPKCSWLEQVLDFWTRLLLTCVGIALVKKMPNSFNKLLVS